MVLAVALAAGACGDDDPTNRPDAGEEPDAMPDAAMPPETFTSFVIDQITNQTLSTTEPVPFATFAALPDPDGAMNNTDAYTSLF